jgi:hypothetical protein
MNVIDWFFDFAILYVMGIPEYLSVGYLQICIHLQSYVFTTFNYRICMLVFCEIVIRQGQYQVLHVKL